ncbi:MAG: dynamin family protein [Propionivibrio sp.]
MKPPTAQPPSEKTESPGGLAEGGPRTQAVVPVLLAQAIADYSGDPSLQKSLRQLEERLTAGRFHLAILGQIKRGKSTLLNALLGEALVPTSVVPLTAIPTFLRYGPVRKVEVSFQDARPPETFSHEQVAEVSRFLARFVTEAENPGNRLGVAEVEVFHPASILSGGLVVVDTPGIGSTYRHNTEATMAFLSQCDAALFVVSADPPITEVEVDFLRQVRQKVHRLFFILNKVDYLDTAERATALDYLRHVLASQTEAAPEVPIFCVSARRALQAKLEADPERLKASGFEEIEEHLVSFLLQEKAAVLHAAIAHKAAAILDDAAMRTRLTIRSLQLPVEELDARLEVFGKRMADIQHERVLAGDLLAGEKERLHARLEEEIEALRGRAHACLREVVLRAIDRPDGSGASESALQETLAEAIPDFFDRELSLATTGFTQRVAEALRSHQERADALIETLRKTAAELFEIPYHAPDSASAFELTRDPYWVSWKWTSTLSPVPPGLVDRLLPSHLRQSRLRNRILDQIDGLVVANAENLRWSIFQSLDDALRRFAADLDERLADTTTATLGAVSAARQRRQASDEAASKDIEELEAQLTRVNQACETLRSLASRGAPGSPIQPSGE